ncbi:MULTISPECIES: YidC/Oxa1 family membrane protein insertase [Carnobacterium]|mgnify:CR=1 FL=1|uniref:Membrane protein insertase YidC n=2 Tax=Carnobacterium inhibens TaxID=147709 RepID=U5SF70_9LACT|nr:YidC/Oxa1 family membrane protein insertase [Carnobacterium inhibens]AGY82743.1 membrane protein [Carnobacterium inhibens subsp. gilichinskyi]MBC9825544.1 membrane protein insertase YidC [Carnobacterium inhibens]MCM3513095.1 YidC/Oxa1 family membrane protein insertase [Carnobacterium inhibens]
MNKRKRLLLLLGTVLLAVVLVGCGTSPITEQSTGIWDRYIILNFSRVIIWFSNLFGGSYGIGIIIFTLIIRLILLPIMHRQTKSTQKMAELQPQLKELQTKYASKDTDTQNKLKEETSKLYAEAGVNPVAGCLPLLIQMPVLIAMYQAISRTDVLKTGNFLWMNLGEPDHYFILPILAAALTYGTTKLSSMSQAESNPTTTSMMYIMPALILFMGITLPSALSLYWVVGNAFSVGQTLLLNNPFKIKKEREEKIRVERERQRALEKALKPKKKKKK